MYIKVLTQEKKAQSWNLFCILRLDFKTCRPLRISLSSETPLETAAVRSAQGPIVSLYYLDKDLEVSLKCSFNAFRSS